MSITRHHNEWLQLVPNSGPFVSLPVLKDVFPQGLDAHDAEHARRLRQAFGEWEDDQSGKRPDPAVHRAWIKFVLTETLGFEDVLAEGQAIPQTLRSEVGEYNLTLRPDWIVNDPSTNKPRLLVQAYPRTQPLTKPVANSPWKTSPDTRMMHLLHDTGIRLGVVTNGDHWMLVNAPKGETTGFASWYATLWQEEPLTLRAFRTLLSAERFFGVPDEETIESLLIRSADDQQEVTDQLGYQVRKAVEVLIQSLDKADLDHGRKLLTGVEEKTLYEAALTVMMRLVFLFCAEERDLLLLGDDLYDRHFAISTLREQLRDTADQFGEEILGLRNDAWIRLLTTFRAVYAGAKHDRLKLPAYGGNLFNPDRFPFLEGRQLGTSWRNMEASPLPISNRTVLHLLEALQLLQINIPGGGKETRKLSFRWLGIEQIGHVYEGLLDHTAVRATEPVLGLEGTRDNEPEIPLAELERLRERGEKELLDYLKKATGRSSVSPIKKALEATLDDQQITRFRTACQGDEALWQRTKPFAGLVREDDNGYPVVVLPGSMYVTTGTDRRSSGTHYTPRSLTEPIVQYTLEPLVYFGPAEGLPRTEWKLKTPTELLDLKICDMACGSGAFLVQACRYMAERLQEAWVEMERAVERGEVRLYEPPTIGKATEAEEAAPPRTSPYGFESEGEPQEQLLPATDEEREILALRLVAQRCLYGVDKNRLAVEMAKLSLWLLTLAKDKPFEFLDHAIRPGDSLVGIHNLDQLRKFNLDGKGEGNQLFLQFLDERIKEAINLRRRITTKDAHSAEDVEAQERLHKEANEKLERLKLAADMLVAASLCDGTKSDKRAALLNASIQVSVHFNHSDVDTFRSEAVTLLAGQQTFHWPLEFPEVFVGRDGFDAFLGNPPFVNAIEGGLSATLKSWLSCLPHTLTGTADFAFYFLAQAHMFCRSIGSVGMLMPRPFLNAKAATQFRTELLNSRPPAILFTPEHSSLFAYANVRVTAVVLSKRGTCIGWVEGEPREVEIQTDNWWAAIAGATAEESGLANGKRLADVFDIAASMTTQLAYEVKEFLEDRTDTDWPRLVTTGLIDPCKCLWGETPCRYLKADYLNPVIRPSSGLPDSLKKRLEIAKRPKILVAGVAGPGGRLEAFVDPHGVTCGAVSTYTITHSSNSVAVLNELCRFLNSEAVAAKVFSELNASSMGSGLLTIKKSFLADLLVPSPTTA